MVVTRLLTPLKRLLRSPSYAHAVSSLSEASASPEIVQHLLEPFEVIRPRPANLRPEDNRLFEHEYRRRFAGTDLYALHDVLATSDGAFIKSGQTIQALRHAADETLSMGRLYSARHTFLSPRKRFDDESKTYVCAFNRWSATNYFHWMCDVLPRVYLARNTVDGCTFVLPANHTAPFISASLAPFRPASVEYFHRLCVAHFNDVIVPGHVAVSGNYHDETIRELSRFLVDAYDSPGGDRSRRIYVTRRKASFRYIENESEVLDVVKRYGFDVVANEDLSFEEQVVLYSRTRFLVGIIGANLTNVMFMEPGAALLQFTRSDDAHNHSYYSLAAAKGVRFYYQHAPYVDTRPGEYWNLRIAIDALENNIEKMLAGEA